MLYERIKAIQKCICFRAMSMTEISLGMIACPRHEVKSTPLFASPKHVNSSTMSQRHTDTTNHQPASKSWLDNAIHRVPSHFRPGLARLGGLCSTRGVETHGIARLCSRTPMYNEDIYEGLCFACNILF